MLFTHIHPLFYCVVLLNNQRRNPEVMSLLTTTILSLSLNSLELDIDGTLEYDKVTIANKSNTYFASIGNNLALVTPNTGHRTYTDFLQNPIAQTFTFNPINEETAIIMINDIRSKTSYGHDGLSSVLLKTTK